MEEWKDIPGYEGVYQISDQGRVKSLSRLTILNKTGAYRIENEKILIPGLYASGYLRVGLHKDKVFRRFFVHRLVCQVFIPNHSKKPCVNHKDGVKTNNCIDNLEWATYSENGKHAYNTGLNIPSSVKGEDSGRAKLTNEQVLFIRSSYPTKEFTRQQLADKYSVDRSVVNRILSRRSWSHI